MSREIRFRAWNIIGRCMFFPPQDDLGWVIAHPRSYHVMQYTGLHDKNGVEIWEGDVVTAEISGLTRKIWVITYDPLGMQFAGAEALYEDLPLDGEMWQMDCAKNTRDSIRSEDGRYILVEVIGNIYQNPELLQGGDASRESA